MAHALAPHFGLYHLDAALVAHNTAVRHPFVLTAETLPVLDRAENLRAEQAVTLGFERPVIDRFRLLDLAVGPLLDPVRRRDLDPHRVEADILRLLEEAHNLRPRLIFRYLFVFHREPPCAKALHPKSKRPYRTGTTYKTRYFLSTLPTKSSPTLSPAPSRSCAR